MPPRLTWEGGGGATAWDDIGAPDAKDLESRGQFVVESPERIPLREAEYGNGLVVRHIKTQEELDQEKALQKKQEREELIQEKMRQMAEEALVAEGKIEPEAG
jgi:hypothetical protein